MPGPTRRHPHADQDGEPKTAEGATEQPGGAEEPEAGSPLDAEALEGKVRPDADDVHGEKKRAIQRHDDGDMTITLAHGLPEGNEFTKDGAQIDPGEELRLPAAQAVTLIRAGYTTADLNDPETIRAQYRRP